MDAINKLKVFFKDDKKFTIAPEVIRNQNTRI